MQKDLNTGLINQKYLGNKGLVLLISFLSAFIPLSTDLYLPALPHMAETFGTSTGIMNSTIILFFAFYAAGTLFWGPLSDKYGRKSILLTGLSIYIAASILCSFSNTVWQLLIFRIFQAIASGAATSVSTAIVKDVYSGRKRESVLAIVQSMAMIVPIVAPILGAFILSLTTWRGIFRVLSLMGSIALICSILFDETLIKKYSGNVFQSMARLQHVLKNSNFTSLLFSFSIMSLPMMAFVSISSYIYIDGFGLSEQQYSFYFAANAVFLVIGPLLYLRISKYLNKNTIIRASFLISAISGLFICVFGSTRPWVFALTLLPATLAGSTIRTPTTNLILDQFHEDIGSASSIMSCAFTFINCIGMWIISFDWPNRILTLGLMYMSLALISLLLWVFISSKPYVQQAFLKPNEHME